MPVSLQRVTNKDLEAWANGSAVRGHVFTRAAAEPYTVSPTRHFGTGAEAPDGWSAHFVSTSGMKSGGSPNQDAYSFTFLDHGWILSIACDGHGEHGEVIAERVSRVLPLFFSANMAESSDPEEALRKAFRLAQGDLERSFSSMQVFSGATVALCCMQPSAGTVWFATVGDSRVVLGDMDSGRPVFATTEHKAHNPDEYSRLEAAGAQVVQKRYDDGEVVSRIFIPKTGVPGLAMSRSLGDGCLKKYGVNGNLADYRVLCWQAMACGSPGVILKHHLATVGYIFIPYLRPEHGWLMGACMIVEVNTWFLIARRALNKRGDRMFTSGVSLWKSARTLAISSCFYITWFVIRLVIYPYLLVVIMREWMKESEKVGTPLNIIAVTPVMQLVFIFLNIKWTVDLFRSKLKGRGASKGL